MADSKKRAAARLEKHEREVRQAACPRAGGCRCHAGRGLNPWVTTCPICGCYNPKFDEAAQAPLSPVGELRRRMGL